MKTMRELLPISIVLNKRATFAFVEAMKQVINKFPGPRRVSLSRFAGLGTLRLTVTCFLLLILSPVKSFSQFEEPDNRILNEFIVMLQPVHSIENILSEIPSLKVKKCLSPRMNIYLLERNSTTSADEFLFSLRSNKHIKLAQFNHRGVENRSLIPNDSFFNRQWNMLNTGQSGGIAGADIEATEAWDINNDNITADDDTVVVAIIDGLFDINHPDLNFFVNNNEVPGNGIDDDGNFYIDDVKGWNIATNSGNVFGLDPHSTHVAGIAAAKGNDSTGVAGVCWGAKILPVNRASNIESDVVAAYDYVRSMRLLYNSTFGTKGAFVVSANSSFGVNNGNPVDYPLWCAMYDSMGAVGILSIGATANSNVNVDITHDMPTECPSKWLITVTNTMNTDNRNAGSGYGPISIDLGAPGTNVYSTTPSNNYGSNTGTSMSAPHVTGTVAAMYAAACKALIDAYHEYPDSIALLVKEYLLDAAEWNSSLNNLTVTNGRLNLFRAISNLKRFNCDSCNFNIAIDKVPITCKGSSNGAMAVIVDSGFIYDYDILWSTGNTSPECLSMQPGFYTVSVRDTATNCRRYMTAEVHNPDTITINAINIIAATDSTPGNISINASAGNEHLLYSLDGSNYQQSAIFSVPVNGTYTVYIKNSSGCIVQQSVLVSGYEELAVGPDCCREQLAVYPNPADEMFTVYSLQFTLKQTPLEVYDAIGQEIYSTVPATQNWKLETGNWQSGVYFLRFGNTTKKLTIVH